MDPAHAPGSRAARRRVVWIASVRSPGKLQPYYRVATGSLRLTGSRRSGAPRSAGVVQTAGLDFQYPGEYGYLLKRTRFCGRDLRTPRPAERSFRSGGGRVQGGDQERGVRSRRPEARGWRVPSSRGWRCGLRTSVRHRFTSPRHTVPRRVHAAPNHDPGSARAFVRGLLPSTPLRDLVARAFGSRHPLEGTTLRFGSYHRTYTARY